MTFYHPTLFIDGTLTDIDAECYILKDDYTGLFKHDSEYLYLLPSPTYLNVDLFEQGMLEFHNKDLFVFRDESDIRVFAERYYNDSNDFNITRDFKEWGDFKLENILDFCDTRRLYTSGGWFKADIYPETLLDTGEFLEEYMSFEKDSGVRIFKGPPSAWGVFQDHVHHLAFAFECRERAYLMLDIFESNRIYSIIDAYLTTTLAPARPHYYGVFAYEIVSCDLLGKEDCVKELKNLTSYAIKDFSSSSVHELPTKISEAISHLVRVLEIRFQHPELQKRGKPEYFVDIESMPRQLSVGLPSTETIRISVSRSKVKIINTTPTTTTCKVEIRIR